MISVDGDTSTNDMVIALAIKLAGNQPLTETHPNWSDFVAGFTHVCQNWPEPLPKMVRVPVS